MQQGFRFAEALPCSQSTNADPMQDHVYWMRRALELAGRAARADEVPVGAVVVYEDAVIGEGWNRPVATHDPSAHAEIMALREAGLRLKNYRLPGAIMYVSLEPCAMCAGALIHARLAKLVYAVADPKSGACGSVFNLLQSPQLNHRVQAEQGPLAAPCRALLRDFFRARRGR